MPGIKQWARTNPERVNELLNANPSYVFFREQPARGNEGDGPTRALGVPLTPERSIAVDARYLPLGAPVFLSASQPDSATSLRRLVVAQDTGGAIRGVVRADFFWGFGAQAERGWTHEAAGPDVGSPTAGSRTKVGRRQRSLVHSCLMLVRA